MNIQLKFQNTILSRQHILYKFIRYLSHEATTHTEDLCLFLINNKGFRAPYRETLHSHFSNLFAANMQECHCNEIRWMASKTKVVKLYTRDGCIVFVEQNSHRSLFMQPNI